MADSNDPVAQPTSPSATPTPGAAPATGAAPTTPAGEVWGPYCWALPESGAATLLVDADIQNAATQLNVDVAAVYAVSDVESSVQGGFDAQNRPTILYEPSQFQTLTGGRYDASRPDLSAAYGSADQLASRKKDQWTLLKAAFMLDADAAVKATSWGRFQVLGSNMGYGGYTDTRTFVNAMFESEGKHLKLFMDFCNATHLVKYLQKQQWTTFARRYNGPRYADNQYDTKLRAAFLRHGGVELPPPAPAHHRRHHAH